MQVVRLRQLVQIATRNFGRFRLQGGLIILASMTGTAGVITSAGYAAGGRQKILDQFSRLGTHCRHASAKPLRRWPCPDRRPHDHIERRRREGY